MGTVSDVIAGGTEGAVQQGPVRARVLNDLSAEEKERYKADILPKDIYSLINHYTDAKDIWENVKMILEGSELTKDDTMNLNTSVKSKEKPFKDTDSSNSIHLYSNPNTDPDRMPLTKAK
ncbi:hypothetical protein Tco_0416322, partial [Tanacetum coccineum]